MLAIYNKELKSYFKSPIGYVFMAFFLGMFGFYFTVFSVFYGKADYTFVLSNITLVILLGVPLLTMRLLSEEKRSKTDQLILTAPVHTSGYILGKYLAAYTLFIVTTLLTVLQPLALSLFGSLPWPKIIGGYIGVLLLGGTFIAIGLFISALTENQIIAAIGSFGVFMAVLYMDNLTQMVPRDRTSSIVFCVILVIIIALAFLNATKHKVASAILALLGFAGILLAYTINPAIFDGFIINFLGWFSLLGRYNAGFFVGVLDISTVVYYISFIIVFVFMTIQVVEKRRWS